MQYPINFPAATPASERLGLNRRQAAIASNFTLVQQTVNTASQWALTWTWPPMRQNIAEPIRAWLNSLRGQVGTFRYYPRQASPSPLSGRTLAAIGYAYNNAALVGGWTSNAPSQLRAGQYLQIGPQLLEIVTAPANADANGRCQIEFEPPLRMTYQVGSSVNFASPSGLFRLNVSDGQTYTLSPGKLSEFGTLTAVEAVEG